MAKAKTPEYTKFENVFKDKLVSQLLESAQKYNLPKEQLDWFKKVKKQLSTARPRLLRCGVAPSSSPPPTPLDDVSSVASTSTSYFI